MEIEKPAPHPRANPRQSTLHEIERILRQASENREPPLSFAEIGRRMTAKKVRPETVKAAVYDLARFRLVTIGTQGVQWIVVPETVWNRPRTPLE